VAQADRVAQADSSGADEGQRGDHVTQASGGASPGQDEVRRVLLTVHTGRRDIVELARTSAARLIAGGIVVRLLEDEAADLDIPDAEVVAAGAGAAQGAEIVMVFGGDGTFLRAAELARYTDAALMGVNLGRVGFLAETEPEAVEETLHAIERCEYSVEERLAIEVDVIDRDGTVVGGTWALNEVSVEKAQRSRVLDVVLAIDGRPLTSFGCDGVLCATPTGSTAYAFSAGGPVIWPDVEAMLLVPSNAHALFSRPLVTSPRSVLTVAVPADGNRSRVSADGRRVLEVPDGGRVDVRRSEQPVRIARVHASTFGDRLVAKFGLPVRGFRDARHAGPGHELFTSRNVLTRDIVDTGNGVGPGSGAPAEEVAGGRTHDDA
jgi:NAD+ kinase